MGGVSKGGFVTKKILFKMAGIFLAEAQSSQRKAQKIFWVKTKP
jgi:hypothetical protein